jgi:hypothetical protein
MIGAQLQAVGHVFRAVELAPEGAAHGRQNARCLLGLGDGAGKGEAVAASMTGASATTPSWRVQTVVRSVAHRRLESATVTWPWAASSRRSATGGRVSPRACITAQTRLWEATRPCRRKTAQTLRTPQPE